MAALLGVLAIFAVSAPAAGASLGASWPSAGQNITNSRSQPFEFTINRSNVSQLAPKWVFTTHGDVSATATVADGAVYFPDWGGYLNAVDANTGKLLWQRQISSYAGEGAGAVSRNSPMVYGNEVILGDNFNAAQSGGAHVFAVSRADGHLLWSTQVDSNPAAQVTANPVVAGGKVIIGVASNEENDAATPSYPCCTFRGSVLALSPSDGHIIWKTYMVPPNSGPCTGHDATGPTGCGYSGGAVWDTPAVDLLTGSVFVGTGNNYSAPDAANACQAAAAANNTSDANCTAPNDYFDSVVALNLYTGQIQWGHKVEGWDAWNVACAVGSPGVTWCPSIASPDYDFGGAGPNLLVVRSPTGGLRTLVGVGQKSGVYWAFDPSTGAVVWHTLVGAGSSLGGIEWGTANDLQRVYVPIADPFGAPYNLLGNPTGTTVYGGSWAALDPQTGKFDWQVSTPDGSGALGPASEANGVVYAGSMAPGTNADNMFALDASTGKVLWSFPSGGSVIAGAAIANGTVYWGSGYSHFGPFFPFSGNNKFYAFSVGGH